MVLNEEDVNIYLCGEKYFLYKFTITDSSF